MSEAWDRLLAPLLRARRFDEILVEHGDELTGAYHVSIGAEASAAALAVVRSDNDVAMLNHRNHGALAALDSDPTAMYRELLGRDGGLQQGRSGSFHLADPKRGVPYTSAMLGGGAALAAGLALARKHRSLPGIAFACFGDGAMGEGIIFETLNLAVAWQLALVFVCDNNAPDHRAGRFARVAEAHGVAGAVADGRDPRQTLTALAAAAHAARSGDGPQFVEVSSEPWPGNAGFLPQARPGLDLTAVTAPPRDVFGAHDPVRAEARVLLGEGVPEQHLLALDRSVSEALRTAMADALRAPPASAASVAENVWGRL